MVSILIAILIFGFLIFIHELGHYTAARIFDVGINEFAVGMGPKLLSKRSKKTGILYSLRALPIGGFVSMVGEDTDTEGENSINSKPVWQRLIVMAAGAFMNIVVGIILSAVLVGMLHNSLGNTRISRLSENALQNENGLKLEDKIVSINGQKVHTDYDFQYALFRCGTEDLTVKVIRDGKSVTLTGVDLTEKVTDESGNEVTSYNFSITKEKFGLGVFIKHTYIRSVTTVRMIWESVIDLIAGKYKLDQLSGPVGITGEIGKAVKNSDGGLTLINLSAVIALNLGVMNLLPFPALDGGRIVFLIIEGIRRKPINRNVEGYIHFAGLALLMLLMLVITFKDIFKLIG